MRTVHLTNAWHPTSGGVQTFSRALLEAAESQGRQVAVIVPGGETSRVDIGPAVRLYTVQAPHSVVLDRRYRTILPHRFLGRSSAIPRIFREERPDLIEISDKYTLCHVAGLFKRRPGPRPTLVGDLGARPAN
jgi:hypothetical protein